MTITEQKIIDGKLGNAPRIRKPRRVIYPDGDGKPMAETIEHRDAMFYAISAAQVAIEDQPDFYVSGNDFLYYVEGDPTKRISPDCYIVRGVPRRTDNPRRFFKVWEEGGKTPCVVFEFTSPKTAKQDRQEKFDLYERTLKVTEYFLFDPLNQYLRPRLQGYRLTNGAYQPIVPDANGRLLSAETGIVMFAGGVLLRFLHPRTGEVIATRAEAEAQIKRETQRAEAQTQRAEAQTQRADAETQARREVEAENARLRAELERLRRGAPPQE